MDNEVELARAPLAASTDGGLELAGFALSVSGREVTETLPSSRAASEAELEASSRETRASSLVELLVARLSSGSRSFRQSVRRFSFGQRPTVAGLPENHFERVSEAVFRNHWQPSEKTVDLPGWLCEAQGDPEGAAAAAAEIGEGGDRWASAASVLEELVLAEGNLPYWAGAPPRLELPLEQYWIFSSHNTYLTGNQLTSASSGDCYARALRLGCRVVEIDLWDGCAAFSGQPYVKHGRTPTMPTSLESCLVAIRDFAFVATDAPLIVTLENHLSEDNQRRCAALIVEIFGDLLYVPKEGGSPLEWPVVNSLLRRILIRDKSVKVLWDENPPVIARRTIPELHRLTSIPSFELKAVEKVAEMRPCTSSSFSNMKFSAMLETEGKRAWREYTSKHIARVYPSGVHMMSSNFCPQDMWDAGCQIVALNLQETALLNSRKLWINAGKFRGNGGCGFVPKPSHLHDGVGRGRFATLKCDLLAGIHWEAFLDHRFRCTSITAPYLCSCPCSEFEVASCSLKCCPSWFPPLLCPLRCLRSLQPYVNLELAGAAPDRGCLRSRTFVPSGHSAADLQPWWEQRFTFALSDLDQAVLCISAWDELLPKGAGTLLGQFAFPVAELRPGWRRVPLLDNEGNQQEGSPALLFHFELDLESSGSA
eukprot:TRINITY_DN20170_c0_g1_i1.p1 TRINITY_DN20170_c0_g1~~TRINITY_DN20170_c0_g1_i1.p1  ORF type:complete len:696 (-),score=104.82 TRINITY_DN20170_c0_g1_i1:30-1985(-)